MSKKSVPVAKSVGMKLNAVPAAHAAPVPAAVRRLHAKEAEDTGQTGHRSPKHEKEEREGVAYKMAAGIGVQVRAEPRP